MGVEFNKKHYRYFWVEWQEPILKWCEKIVEELVRASFTLWHSATVVTIVLLVPTDASTSPAMESHQLQVAVLVRDIKLDRLDFKEYSLWQKNLAFYGGLA